eukprot:NODE_3235_length_812_cov_319.556143.p8 GENE.NODE_3235_length_812_cov_319.556143~~NODE_3235_length_812_cov_319.556143.p8  ORF type:complete len:52 (-),score=7.61 NODE_3235_length_812_cov_319.556143:464-619(-)
MCGCMRTLALECVAVLRVPPSPAECWQQSEPWFTWLGRCARHVRSHVRHRT